MRNAFLLLTVFIGGLLTPAAAQVNQEALPEEEVEALVEPVRRYTVELIIFAYSESATTGNEVWLPDEPAIETSDEPSENIFFDEYGDELTEIESTLSRRYMDLELVLFGEDDYTMTETYNKLVKLDAYEPLVRTGWTQPTYNKELTGPIALDLLAESPPWLDGSLTLYLGRYLHLVVDLSMDSDRSRYRGPEPGAAPVESSPGVLTFGDKRVQHDYPMLDEYGDPILPPIWYRIFEDRIVKNGDIRYFDHPKFGVIAKITRFVEAEEEEFIDDTDDLLPGSS